MPGFFMWFRTSVCCFPYVWQSFKLGVRTCNRADCILLQGIADNCCRGSFQLTAQLSTVLVLWTQFLWDSCRALQDRLSLLALDRIKRVLCLIFADSVPVTILLAVFANEKGIRLLSFLPFISGVCLGSVQFSYYRLVWEVGWQLTVIFRNVGLGGCGCL